MRIRTLTVGISILHEDLSFGGKGLSTKLNEITYQLDIISKALCQAGYEYVQRSYCLTLLDILS